MSDQRATVPALSLADMLDLPVLARARPELIAGAGADLARPVRWVHTSEIYDISPLLKGREVLLTTGLGLIGLSDRALRQYVASLAAVGVTALFLELGRTFTVAPPALVAAADSHRLPVIALHGVVPFIEITEAIHPLLIGGELDALRAGADAADRLVAGLIAGEGLTGLVARIAELVESAVSLCAVNGEVLAGTGALDAESAHPIAITAGGTEWGTLRIAEPLTPSRQAVIERALGLLALEMQRAHPRLRSLDQARGELLGDIVEGRFGSVAELDRRAAGLGLVIAAGQRAVALCVLGPTEPRREPSLLAVARIAARRSFGQALVAAIDDRVVVATAVHPRDLRGRLGAFAATVRDQFDGEGSPSVVVSAGPLVDGLSTLARSVVAAIETAALARRLTPSADVVVADDFALYQLITGLVDDAALERFVQDQIGVLIDFDARTGSDLVRTLDTYLSCSLSKSAAAAALGVRRQTLYGRLERIATLLGGFDVDHRERRTAVDLALVGWRLRTAAATTH